MSNARSLAPKVVLEQSLTVPGAPASLLGALADSAPLLPLSVLRACVNEACTSALLSSAMALDAPSEQDSARLLNDVDRFQSAILAVLDELEGKYRREEGTNGVVHENVDQEGEVFSGAAPPPTKIQRYMLHRTLPSGVDVFTSAAVLSEQDLEALSKIDDTDVIAVHPPPAPTASSSSSSYMLDPLLSDPQSAASAADQVPVPRLGEVNQRPLGWQSARHIAPVARVGAAPGLYGVEAALRKDPGFIDPINPTRRPTVLLRYASPFISSLAPTHDSTGATEPYTASASRALSQLRARRWTQAALDPNGILEQGGQEGEEEELVLSEEESATLRELGVDIQAFLAGAKHSSSSAPPTPSSKKSRPRPAASSTTAVWSALEHNSSLIVRVARAQVARARISYEEELKRLRRRAELAMQRANRPVPVPVPGAPAVVVEASGEEGEKGFVVERAGKAELEDAEALLDSLVSLIASLPKSTSDSTSSDSPLPRLVPPPAFLAKLAPLLLAARTKEPSFRGTLDPINDRAVKMRESVLPLAQVGGGGLGALGEGDQQQMDLRV
ncbi:hypothetical protein JCM10908_003158 [Rhodotorula pacifica]|uniref:uncharacterized protein n=1 Tax=Rhodotorula pacifica TaxID=1495444 RepID=UPI003177BD89